MKIFINDKPLDVMSANELPKEKTFECVYDHPEDIPATIDFHDDVLIIEPVKDVIIKLLYLLRTRKLKNLDSVTILTENKKEVKRFIKSRFTVIKAAGGVVTKGQKIPYLFLDWENGIYRKENLIKVRLRKNVPSERWKKNAPLR
jgi:8-oxo-(d)GTP phosphatase